MGFYVPQSMKNAKRWILWRLEDGKKKPYSANYDGLASSTNANTWAYYDKALKKLEYSDYNGLGFVFAEGDGLVFIDLDNCVNEAGELTDFAESIINLFPDTYTEYSQSEQGLHIVAKGTIPRNYKSEKIEIYSNRRYMACTGNAYTVADLKPSQAAIDELCKRLNIAASAVQIEHRPLTVNDSDIINKAKRGGNGKEFTLLWAGQWERKYKSQSEADLRLISILYYYSGNAEQVERLFKNSGLGQRDKGQNSDYVQRTIQKAAKNTKPYSGQNKGYSRIRRYNLTDTPDPPKKTRRLTT